MIVTDLSQLATIKGPCKVTIPAGTYEFASWPSINQNRVHIVADGPVFLKHTGTGDAITFDGTGLPGGGMFGCKFEGFIIVPGPKTTRPLVLKSFHHGKVGVTVHGAGQNCPAISMLFCVCTELHPVVSNVEASVDGYPIAMPNVVGVYMDAWPAGSPNRTTACVIRQPILEGLNTGIQIIGADLCVIDGAGGTIEDGGYGITLGEATGEARPGSHIIREMEMEGNSAYDVYFGPGAHNNRVVYAGNPKLNVYHAVAELKELIPNNKVISTTDLL